MNATTLPVPAGGPRRLLRALASTRLTLVALRWRTSPVFPSGSTSSPSACRGSGRRPSTGTTAARVRNVILPAGYHHVTTPFAQALAEDPATREWIDAYVPDAALPDPPPETVGYGVMWAADVWHSVKKHWALEAQRFVRARRALAGGLK